MDSAKMCLVLAMVASTAQAVPSLRPVTGTHMVPSTFSGYNPHQPHHYGPAVPPRTTALRMSESDFDDVAEAEKKALQAERLKTKAAKEEKQSKAAGLDDWRDKTGKGRQADRNREREERDAQVSKGLAAAREGKEEALWADEEEAAWGGMTEEEAQALNDKYAEVQPELIRNDLAALIAELDSEMEIEQEWQSAMKETLQKVLKTQMEETQLEQVEEDGKQQQQKEKVTAAQEKEAALDNWKAKKEKQAQAEKEAIKKAIAKKRRSQIDAKYRDGADDMDMDDFEELDENTVEWLALESRVNKIKEEIEAQKIRNAALRDILMKEAAQLAEEEDFISLEADGQQAADEVKAKTTKAKAEKKAKLMGLELWRQKTGKAHDIAALTRKEWQKKKDKSRQLNRDTKEAMVAGAELSEEDLEAMALDAEFAEGGPGEIAYVTQKILAMEAALEQAQSVRDDMTGTMLERSTYETMLSGIEEMEEIAAAERKVRNKERAAERKAKSAGLDSWREKTGKGAQAERDQERKAKDKKIAKAKKERRNDDDDDLSGGGMAAGADSDADDEAYPDDITASFKSMLQPLNLLLAGVAGTLAGATTYLLQSRRRAAGLTTVPAVYYSTVEV